MAAAVVAPSAHDLAADVATPNLTAASPSRPSISFPLAPKDSPITLQTGDGLGNAVPLDLEALLSEVHRLSASSAGSTVIQDLLDAHGGAVFFSGLGQAGLLKSPTEFSRFAHAFGWSPHEDIGNPVRRTVLADNVATANEGPNTAPVYPHNEFALSPHYPAYVFFFCVEAPESGESDLGPRCLRNRAAHHATGGETPINNSIVLYERMKAAYPEFVEEIGRRVSVGQLWFSFSVV